ncbi:hypothetical protein [Streptomyces palmae]|uniref:Tetratricopeptide repeat protein n=1 Tax=Streptomyces palmae TaxID=1701085 RepID=A0A4Z0HAE6_9ACTN|nr:hypothetical protein [Streptomyces palmae]TGB11185.1 hypothetical protein E4099_12230 [Streptomyces palmae]
MNEPEKVDQDDVLRARTLLLGSGWLSPREEVEAYRVLAKVSPLAYLPKLAEALVSYGRSRELEDRPEQQLALQAEAAATARRIDAGHPRRAELLVRALDAYQHQLYAARRRAEGFAICEEMAEVGQWGFERGQVSSPMYGHGRLAAVLAEEGCHQEAADIYGKCVQAEGPGNPTQVSPWTPWSKVEWAAELDAAGHQDAALAAFAQIIEAGRAALDVDEYPLVMLVWQLVHHARMLDAAGRRAEAGRAHQEALALLAELAETGERKSWSYFHASWTTLFALSGRSAEPAASPSAPAPPFGSDLIQWSPDVKQAYYDGLPALEEEAAARAEAARTDPHGHLAEAVAVHRRLTIRSALCWQHRAYLVQEPLGPVFDQGVALARRLADLEGADRGREALGGALADRAMFLVATRQYGAAHKDFLEAVPLLG